MTTAKGGELQGSGAKKGAAPVNGPAQGSDPGITLVEAVSAEQLAEVFRLAGYRVTPAEQNGRVQLMSASQGVGFTVRFGNPAVQATTHIDYTLSCAMQVQGELPADLVPSWNRTKRFARLAAHQQFLLLEMDVMVAGGVTERYLRSTIELWDRLVQEFLLHLRNRPAMAATEAVTETATQAATQVVRTAAGATLTPASAGTQAGGPDSEIASADGTKATLQ